MSNSDEGNRPKPAAHVDKTREHLANERTFLAWIRTALALLGLGFVVARLGLFLREMALQSGQLPPPSQGRDFVIAGGLLLAVGVAFSIWSAVDYQQARKRIEADAFEPRGWAIFLMAVVVSLLGGSLILMLLWRLVSA